MKEIPTTIAKTLKNVLDLETFAFRQLPDLNNKKPLLYGCGANLKPALKFAKSGAKVHMIDISPKSTCQLKMTDNWLIIWYSSPQLIKAATDE